MSKYIAMQRRVLVVWEGGSEAEESVRQAAWFAEMIGARLAVASDGAGRGVEARRAVTARIREITGRAVEDFEVGALPAHQRWPVAEASRAYGADLVVVSARAPEGVAARLRGGADAEVIRHGRSALLVARQGPRTGHVLAATDLSDPSFPAICTAAEVARHAGARLTVLHCLEEPASWGPGEIAGGAIAYTEAAPGARESLERQGRARVRAALSAVGASGATVVRFGPPAPAIARLAAELPAELVVVGTVGRRGLRRLLLGNTAETVLRGACCSVLVERLGGPAA